MLDDRYLLHGLDALCRAHEMDYFTDGHRGAAMIAATFLCREIDLEDGAADVIGGMIDEHWAHTDLCAPFPDEAPAPDLIPRVAQAIERSMDRLRQAGHNVILPSLALKAFHHMRDAATPARIEGLCKLIESFTTAEDIDLDDGDHIPVLSDLERPAEFILAELLKCIDAFDGRGQGWSGHLLTYGRALLDLRHHGYDALARAGDHAFRLYIKRIRMGPQSTDKPRPEHPPSELVPHQLAYWQARRTAPVGIGHVFKYPYGLTGLLDLSRDEDLMGRCMEAAYHVL